jgi:hypothetical protein
VTARLTPLDERLAHQIPEPFPAVVTHHEHWRESYFFVLHPGAGHDGDVVILTMATYPATARLDSYQMGRIGGSHVFALHERPYGDDPHETLVGPVRVEIEEPYRRLRLTVDQRRAAPSGLSVARPELDLVVEARTEPYAMRRGTMKAGHEIVWDQCQMIQSGRFSGWYGTRDDRREVDGWWGQRDHSWGIRDHVRCPMWLWLALQLPDAMIGAWHWELANGARIFTDGCVAPAGGGEPVPVVDLHHELSWTGEGGRPVSYGEHGELVTGLAGRVELVLAGGERLGLEVEGAWAARYGPRGGGQHLCTVTLDDGRVGNGVVEITGAHHHRYFPVARATGLPE